MLRRAASTLHSSNPRLCRRETCPSTLERRFSDLATNATPPLRSDLGGILTRSSNRRVLPSANDRPLRQQQFQDKQGSPNARLSAVTRRSGLHRASKDDGKRVVPSASEQTSRASGGADGKAQPPFVKNVGNSNTAKQSLVQIRANVQDSPKGQHHILPKNTLAELFSPRVHSARHTKGRGGDYSGYLPPTVTSSLSNLGPIERAQLALGRNKEVPFKSQSRVLDIIKQTVEGRAGPRGEIYRPISSFIPTFFTTA
ncbi:hypothetical protein SCLCIDRAFT_518370 [Scleroderma citrinum Foug A]|uniref:Uncharacterized protein n=1 Tax=Scleroderma citrinum Foug A TaxID=1036808 RepID=A0A0C3ER19_9AGAM|nr:hypothetical protein SCLCIDRAFT_518370 [Scleroderma citrinum Foug A]